MSKIYPNQTFEEIARKTSAHVAVLWEIKGPPHTQVAYLTCYLINGRTAILETFKDGKSWEIYTPPNTPDVLSSIADAFNRLGIPSDQGIAS